MVDELEDEPYDGSAVELEEDVYNGEAGHALKHNAVNKQTNWLTQQWAERANDPLLSASYGRGISAAAFNAVGDDVTSNTTRLQAALDAAPYGSTVYVPQAMSGGAYKTGPITIPPGVELCGSGMRYKRDAIQFFGDAANLSRSNYDGAVLAFTNTTGDSITMSGGGLTRQGGKLRDILIVGPGSGSSVGVHASTMFETDWHNVAVINFATGVKMTTVEDCQFFGLRIMGCTQALAMETDTNQNAFYLLDMQRCAAGLTLDASSVANAFYSMIAQSLTGISAYLRGNNNKLVNPYIENPTGPTYAIVVDGRGHTIDNPVLSNNNIDGIDLVSTSKNCQVTAISMVNFACPIRDNGEGNLFSGDTNTLSGSGTKRVILDGLRGLTRFAGGATVGDRNAAGAQAFWESDVAAGSSGGYAISVAGVRGWQLYEAGGDLDFVYLRDVANGRMLVTYKRGASAAASQVSFGGMVQLPHMTTANRPAASIGPGFCYFDDTIGKPVWSDGANWHDAMYNLV